MKLYSFAACAVLILNLGINQCGFAQPRTKEEIRQYCLRLVDTLHLTKAQYSEMVSIHSKLFKKYPMLGEPNVDPEKLKEARRNFDFEISRKLTDVLNSHQWEDWRTFKARERASANDQSTE
jgi:hypothetical protein